MRNLHVEGGESRTGSGFGGTIFVLLLFGLGLVVAPIAAAIADKNLGALASAVMIGAGVFFLVVSTALIVITKLYVRTRADEAYVRTGKGGIKVIKDGGAIVIPVVHEIVRVSLRTMMIAIKRGGDIITLDNLRADVQAQFYLRVEPEDDAIKAAARSLGDKMSDPEVIQGLIEDKMINAFRTAASIRTLQQLNNDRDALVQAVMETIRQDLKHNGLTLESVTISKLDQTDTSTLRETNVFDAQGLRSSAEITQKARTEKNAIEREGELTRAKRDVETQRALLDLGRQQAEAEAQQATEIAQIRAAAERASKEKQIAADQAVKIAETTRDRATQVAVEERAQAVAVAKETREQATAVAEAARAAREAERAMAEAERERAQQAIETVKAQAAAERQMTVEVTKAQGDAKQRQLQAEQSANAEAYATERAAAAAAVKLQKEAEAKKASADAESEATKKRAEADAAAQVARAEAEATAQLRRSEAEAAGTLAVQKAQADGRKAIVEAERAVAMIPIDVDKARVEVERSRVDVRSAEVDVLQRELQAREAHGGAMQEFEVRKLQVEASRDVQIAYASASAKFGEKFSANIYGTAEDVKKMSDMFLRGQGGATLLGGFLSEADPEIVEAAKQAGMTVRDFLLALVKRTRTREDVATILGRPKLPEQPVGNGS